MLYVGLMQFLISDNTTQTLSYYEINNENIESYMNDVTMSNSIKNDNDVYKIESIDSKLADTFAKLITTPQKTTNSIARSKTINIDQVDLNFPDLVEGYYGGDQSWWNDSRAKYGCAAVAVSNLMAYYALFDDRVGALYQGSSHKKSAYVKHMSNVEEYVYADVGGRPLADEVMEDGYLYSEQRLSAHYLQTYLFTGLTAQDPIADFIKDGLNSDSPVLYSQIFGAYKEYNLHWMTITKFFENNQGRWIALSTWGERISLDLELIVDDLMQTFSNYGFGYYEVCNMN